MTTRERLMREKFAQLATEPDATMDLARGALLIAAEEIDVDIEGVLAQLAAMGHEVRGRITAGAPPDVRYNHLSNHLHRDIGLKGDANTYYDPKNSFLSEVLSRKKGIPITLSVIYIAVARAAGLHLVGVSFPAHFLLGAYAAAPSPGQTPDWFIDPFYPTELLRIDDCRNLFVKLGGKAQAFRERMLEPATTRQILTRMLTNLKMIYAQTNESEKSIAAIDRILLLNPNAITEYRDRAVLYMHLDLYSLALADFEHYLAKEPNAKERQSIERAVEDLKARIAMLH